MAGDDDATASSSGGDRQTELEPLHWGVRLATLIVGGVLTVIGIAGLVLPGIQGILTIVLGLAVISLGSEFVHRRLRRFLARWPQAQRRMDAFRTRVHGWLAPSRRDRDGP